VKKDVKSKVVARKWLDGRLIAKILIMKIQLNLCCLLHGFVLSILAKKNSYATKGS